MVRDRRRFLLFSLFLTFSLSGGLMAVAKGNGGSGQVGFCEKMKPCQLLVQSDAERILGQPARLTQDTSVLKGDVRQCLCAYTGVSKDKASGQDVYLFFSLEQKEVTPSAEQAHQVLKTTKAENEHDLDILDLTGIGDEAILLSNDADSHLIMARKGGIIMRLQAKKAAEKTSLNDLKAFAERVFKQL
jgi:hypothetical protein